MIRPERNYRTGFTRMESRSYTSLWKGSAAGRNYGKRGEALRPGLQMIWYNESYPATGNQGIPLPWVFSDEDITVEIRQSVEGTAAQRERCSSDSSIRRNSAGGGGCSGKGRLHMNWIRIPVLLWNRREQVSDASGQCG